MQTRHLHSSFIRAAILGLRFNRISSLVLVAAFLVQVVLSLQCASADSAQGSAQTSVQNSVQNSAQDSQQGASPTAEPQVFSPAPVPANDQPTFLKSLMDMLPMLAICYAIFYMMVIKPQDTKSKSHKTLVESLKRGEEVLTRGGIIGRVTSVQGEVVGVEISSGVEVKVTTDAIARKWEGNKKKEAA